MSAKKRADGIVVGVKQTLRMIEQGRLSEVDIAKDADSFVTKGVERAAEKSGVRVTRVPSKRQLGARCGIEIGAAVAGIVLPDRRTADAGESASPPGHQI